MRKQEELETKIEVFASREKKVWARRKIQEVVCREKEDVRRLEAWRLDGRFLLGREQPVQGWAFLVFAPKASTGYRAIHRDLDGLRPETLAWTTILPLLPLVVLEKELETTKGSPRIFSSCRRYSLWPSGWSSRKP